MPGCGCIAGTGSLLVAASYFGAAVLAADLDRRMTTLKVPQRCSKPACGSAGGGLHAGDGGAGVVRQGTTKNITTNFAAYGLPELLGVVQCVPHRCRAV